MFDISWYEMLVVALAALLLIGPEELPVVIKNVKKFVKTIRSLGNQFTSTIAEIEKEVGLAEEAEKVNNEIKRIVDLEGNLQNTYDISELKKKDKSKGN